MFRLFVRDFTDDMDAEDLEALFSNVGNVRSISVEMLSRNGISRRVAYVEMSSAEEIRDCIERFHGFKSRGKALTVTEDKPATA